MTSVAVCIATLQRPIGLRQLLTSLAEMRRPKDVDVRVIVVDNDEGRSAEEVVRETVEHLAMTVEYVVEPERGIPFARNRAVQAAGAVDWVVFVDDDEIVDSDWLTQLLRVAEAFQADVVTGPVLPVFEVPPPAWVRRGRFYERPRFLTGEAIHYARTSNALVSGRLLVGQSRPFNEAMRNNGGDDTHFFQRVRLSGRKIVWADEAIVHETVPGSRVNVRWLVRRAYRRGNTLSLCLRDLEDSWGRRGKRSVAAMAHASVGAWTLLTSVLRGRSALVMGLQKIAFALGLLTGLGGRSYQEYATVHGR